jgi:DNA polymerase-3 subunit delta
MIDEISGFQKLERKYRQEISSFYVVVFKRPYRQRLTRWITGRFEAEGKSIDREAAQLLVTLTGEDLSDIVNGVTNTVLFIGDKDRVEKDDVGKAVGASRSDNVFELSKAIGERDFDKARIMIRRMIGRGEKPSFVIYVISDYFFNLMKVNSLKGRGLSKKAMLKELGGPEWLFERYSSYAENFSRAEITGNLRALRDADNKFKSSGYDPTTVMELLIHDICSPKD